VRFGKPHQFGLEAGSKPELMIALAMLDTPRALLICNGYKDREHRNGDVSHSTRGRRRLLIEQIKVELVITASRQLGIQPILGVR